MNLPWPGQIRLYANATRHVRIAGTPRLGATVEVRAHARAAQTIAPLLAATFASVGLAPVPIALPPFGDVRLDPTTVMSLGAGFTDPQLGYHASSLSIPNVPALVGAALHFQALVENRTPANQPELRLTNAMRLVVVP